VIRAGARPSPESRRAGALRLLAALLAAPLVVAGARAIAWIVRVEGASMGPALQRGGWIVVRRRWRRQQPLRRGQVALVRRPDEPARECLKRVVGLPGESISIHGGRVHVQGRPLEEPYACSDPDESWGPIVLRDGEYVVLGDNRRYSTDSRVWGPVRAGDVTGIAVGSRRTIERRP